MNVIIAKTAGFCKGVRRAVELAFDASISQESPVYTYGPLIHNTQVLSLLKQQGVSILEEIPEKGTGTVLIRAHGIPPPDKKRLEDSGFKIIDATCPRVIRVQTIILKHKEKGYASIIIGDKNHPEVKGLLGCTGEKGYVISDLSDFKSLPKFDKAIIIAQTTQNKFLFDQLVKQSNAIFPHYKVFNTICDSTEKRQQEIKELSESVDASVIVGSHRSGNTCRLAEVAARSGKPYIHVENESELNFDLLSHTDQIGVTAGASTPNWVIRNVCRAIETRLEKNSGRGGNALQVS